MIFWSVRCDNTGMSIKAVWSVFSQEAHSEVNLYGLIDIRSVRPFKDHVTEPPERCGHARKFFPHLFSLRSFFHSSEITVFTVSSLTLVIIFSHMEVFHLVFESQQHLD